MNQLNHTDNRNRDLSSRHQLRRLVLMLAIPIIAENLLLSMMEYVDTAMVGSLGPNATAAVAKKGSQGDYLAQSPGIVPGAAELYE